MPVTEADVIWAYRNFLGRAPENDAVVELHCHAEDLRTLCEILVNSDEFKERVAPTKRDERASVPVFMRPLPIDTEANPDELRKLWQRVQRAWTHEGENQPFHSVLADDRFLPEQLNKFEDLFWETGLWEAKGVVDHLADLGLMRLAEATLLEFGCGVGRMTMPFAQEFARIIAYDISEPHLVIARERAAVLGLTNIYTVAIGRDVPTEFEPCDVFYSNIVLQHNPPPIIGHVLRKLIHSLKPGGFGIFQVPVYNVDYRFNLREVLKSGAPMDTTMHCYPQAELFSLITQSGARLIEVREDDAPGPRGGPFVSNTVVLKRAK